MTNKITKPMLAATLDSIETLEFPILCTPKIDGIRCLILNNKAVTRTFKSVPNVLISKLLSKLPNNLDGELFATDFATTSSIVMSRDKSEAHLTYYIFDYVPGPLSMPYVDRMKALSKLGLEKPLKEGKMRIDVQFLLPKMIKDKRALLSFQTQVLKHGFEGAMLRDPSGPYKCGRATLKSGDLTKLKNFFDDEAKVTGFEEGLSNNNEARRNGVGAKVRGSSKENKVGKNTLGALRVQPKNGVEFKIGSGFDDAERQEIWKNQKKYLGKLVKYKYFEKNKKSGAPRFPTFLGFRSRLDI